MAKRGNESNPPSTASPAERLRRGEITMSGFLDAHVDRALAAVPIMSSLAPDDVEHVRAILDEKMRTDPVVRRLVDSVVASLRRS